MLTTERHEMILNLLKEKQIVTIQEITDVTDASESTIRRDLTELEKRGDLERVHGGARFNERKVQEYSISEKESQNLQEKIEIAKYAASLVKDGDCIFLDAGTTTIQLIPFLQHKDVIVVTNGLPHIDLLTKHGITSYVTGGLIKAKTGALIGPQAIKSLNDFCFDLCFLGVNGFHYEFGYNTPDPEEAHIKQTAHKLAKVSYVLADHSKHKKVSFSKIFDLAKARLITSNLPKNEVETLSEITDIKGLST
ncbi:DeoR/GlpR family DNA-binding transcription regulator [Salinibacillus xinjiangensis]|uniref:DeoR family transcriptional regulator n=1 Tax=Salinibacillus xinjiangensis TaxID=1229268 RepID=A0A6G1XBN6_9BACI|nr:DeoR/GlpR family DNA-binding transcription regulator [Salinibacillus xinjiangensis]MRG88329.1 DeoR family transcriptional regulator [Salinibacillus xinjiangensis]